MCAIHRMSTPSPLICIICAPIRVDSLLTPKRIPLPSPRRRASPWEGDFQSPSPLPPRRSRHASRAARRAFLFPPCATHFKSALHIASFPIGIISAICAPIRVDSLLTPKRIPFPSPRRRASPWEGDFQSPSPLPPRRSRHASRAARRAFLFPPCATHFKSALHIASSASSAPSV